VRSNKTNINAPIATLRARVGALTRYRPACHPELIAAHRELTTRRIEAVIADSPVQLTDSQIDRVVAVLRGGAR